MPAATEGGTLQAMDGRKAAALFVLGTIFVILVGRAWTVGDQVASFGEAVPGFACPPVAVKTSSAHRSWSGRFRSASSTVYMSRDCRRRLRETVARHPEFTEAKCGPVRRCWTRESGDRVYELTFELDDVDHVGFRYRDYR